MFVPPSAPCLGVWAHTSHNSPIHMCPTCAFCWAVTWLPTWKWVWNSAFGSDKSEVTVQLIWLYSCRLSQKNDQIMIFSLSILIFSIYLLLSHSSQLVPAAVWCLSVLFPSRCYHLLDHRFPGVVAALGFSSSWSVSSWTPAHLWTHLPPVSIAKNQIVELLFRLYKSWAMNVLTSCVCSILMV